MLKEQLLKESQEIEVNVELDSIFESVELNETEKESFKDVFEIAVKKHAVALSESHIALIGEKADQLVESEVEEKTKEIHEKLLDTAKRFYKHLSEEWLKENKLAVDRSIKAELFESMFVGLKDLFVEHNVELPAESVDVVKELEEALEEAEKETSKMFDQLTESKQELSGLKRAVSIKSAVEGLTESQKEKVEQLVEDVEYSEKFDAKLGALVEMAKAQKVEKPLTEETTKVNTEVEDGLNFVVEKAADTEVKKPHSNVSSYIQAAIKL